MNEATQDECIMNLNAICESQQRQIQMITKRIISLSEELYKHKLKEHFLEKRFNLTL